MTDISMTTDQLLYMIHRRDLAYNNVTSAILNSIDYVLEGIGLFFDEVDGVIEYADITILQDDNIIITSKPIKSKVSDQLIQISVGLPIEVIAEQSATAVYKFLLNAELVKSQQEQLEETAIASTVQKKHRVH